MNNSIYDIQNDLLEIFDELENNDGLLTEELELKLDIAQDSFKNKIKSYCDYIKHLESDLTEIKIEKQRLDNLKKVKERTIENLKNIMVYAINQFGDVNKSGNHYVDYGTGKVTIKPTESINISDDILTGITDTIMQYFEFANMTNQQKDFDSLEDLVDDINSHKTDDQPTITTDDLQLINGNFTLDVNLNDFLDHPECIALIKSIIQAKQSYTNPIKLVDFKPIISKTALKESIKKIGIEPSFANLNVKDSLIIK